MKNLDNERNSLSTAFLKKQLLESDNIDTFIKSHRQSLAINTFGDYFYQLIQEKSLKATEVFLLAQINESYGYQLLNGKRQPSRDKVIQLALGLGADLFEINRLLLLAGKSELYVKNQRDAVFMYAFNKGWSLNKTETLLIGRNLGGLMPQVEQ